jgi:hypothetical protein
MWEFLKNYKKNEFTTHFEQKFTMGSCGLILELGMLGVAEMLMKYVVYLSKRKNLKNDLSLIPSFIWWYVMMRIVDSILTPKGLGVPYMEFRDFGQVSMNAINFWISWNLLRL